MRRFPAAVACSAVALAVVAIGGTAARAAAPDDPSNVRGNNYETVYNHNGTCFNGTKTLTGVIKGMDNHAVNVFIGFDIRDSKGNAIDGGGCGGSRKDNTTSYAVTLHMNYWISSAGIDPASDTSTTTTFSAVVPGNAALVDLEASAQRQIPRDHPQGAKAGGGDSTYYGNSRLGNVKIGAGSTITTPSLIMPNNSPCGTQTTGAVTGYFYKNGHVVNGVYVAAFAEDPKYSGTPAAKGPFGYGRWTNASGYRGYTITRLAASTSTNAGGEAYTMIARLADGTSKQFYMVDGTGRRTGGVKPCVTTRFDLHF